LYRFYLINSSDVISHKSIFISVGVIFIILGLIIDI